MGLRGRRINIFLNYLFDKQKNTTNFLGVNCYFYKYFRYILKIILVLNRKQTFETIVKLWYFLAKYVLLAKV
jgi:hypothetical protein